ncbi:MAG: phosphomannomutase [Rhodobacteraceae bacterium]|nr:phosphomannomutase [Paracoccaceae bacterium]
MSVHEFRYPGRPSGSPAAASCFKAYDIRGQIGNDFNEETAWRIGRAYAKVMSPGMVVVGRDCRDSSPAMQEALIEGLLDIGMDVADIGLSGTEEVYFATAHLGASGGIEVTASHNPIDYNGFKMVGPGSRPLTQEEFDAIKHEFLTDRLEFRYDLRRGTRSHVSVRKHYARKVASFVQPDQLRPLKLVVNAGNGVGGQAFDAILQELQAAGAVLDVHRIQHDPDGTFPNGIPNPLLPENRAATADAVRETGADLGIAWDGDFDRCFFFDETGAFVDGEYLVGLLAAAFLEEAPGERIVHDPRVLWNTRDIVARFGGEAVVSKTGHAHVKRMMRDAGAIYGGEMSAHHYFADFMYCDSGMIPWLKVIERMSTTGQPLSALVGEMQAKFPSSGEINFKIANPDAAMARVIDALGAAAVEMDGLDGISMSFPEWRLNLRSSSTEPLLRLNIEASRSREIVDNRVEMVRALIENR